MNESSSPRDVAVFGGGCFWCTEAVFKMLKGVYAVGPGYTGGRVANPSYDQVSMGNTGHVEVVRVEYDPREVSYKTLLTIFFASHDATQVNRQGNDVGEQYRSVIFYTSESHKQEAEMFIATLDASAKDGDPIATTVEPLGEFYDAEGYHKDFYARNPNQGYCQVIIAPKLQKVQKEFAELLKSGAA